MERLYHRFGLLTRVFLEPFFERGGVLDVVIVDRGAAKGGEVGAGL